MRRLTMGMGESDSLRLREVTGLQDGVNKVVGQRRKKRKKEKARK